MRGCYAGFLLQDKSDGALGRSRTDNLLIRSNTPNDYPLVRECFHKGYFTSTESPNVRNSQTIG